jgi:hypothetical protein
VRKVDAEIESYVGLVPSFVGYRPGGLQDKKKPALGGFFVTT